MGKPDASPLLQLDDADNSSSFPPRHVLAADPASSVFVAGAGRHHFFNADNNAQQFRFSDNDNADDDDVLPPLYTDVLEADAAGQNAAAISIPRENVDRDHADVDVDVDADAESVAATAPLLPTPAAAPHHVTSRGGPVEPCQIPMPAHQPWHYCLAPRPDNHIDLVPDFTNAVRRWSERPPRPFVQLRGTHSERRSREKGKRENVTVVDFDLRIELTPYLFSDANRFISWSAIHVPHNDERAFRGSVFRKRAPGHKALAKAKKARAKAKARARRSAAADDLEQGGALQDLPGVGGDDDSDNIEPRPTVVDWCQRFCEAPSPLRSFTLRRRMTGFDYAKVKAQLEMLVRRTNYLGNVDVSFPVNEQGVVCYSDHRFNQWRITRWIQFVCALTLMILFTWPYLFFRTKKYDVVTVDWPFSRIAPSRDKEYVSISEDEWCRLWERAITKGVLSKRQGLLDQEDLRMAAAPEPTFASTGHGSIDNALGFVSAGINAISQVNWALGWGGDQ